MPTFSQTSFMYIRRFCMESSWFLKLNHQKDNVSLILMHGVEHLEVALNWVRWRQARLMQRSTLWSLCDDWRHSCNPIDSSFETGNIPDTQIIGFICKIMTRTLGSLRWVDCGICAVKKLWLLDLRAWSWTNPFSNMTRGIENMPFCVVLRWHMGFTGAGPPLYAQSLPGPPFIKRSPDSISWLQWLNPQNLITQ